MAKCPYCDSLVDDSLHVCCFCGAKLEPPAETFLSESERAPESAEAPGVQTVPSEPVQELFPQQPLQQPQTVYPAVEKKKKRRKWLIPVILGAVLTVLVLIGAAFALYSVGMKAMDPNLGTYKATNVSYYGMDLDLEETFPDGFTIELKTDGKCIIEFDNSKGAGSWKVEDGSITIYDGSRSVEGTIDNGVISIENMLDLGLDIKLVRQEE